MKSPEDNVIAVMTDKEITKLYKTLLEIVEDLQKDHSIMLDKIAKQSGQEFADNINYFTSAKHDQIRKRILDSGNECGRNILNFLSFFDSTLNVQRASELYNQRIITKKTFISHPVIL